MAKKTKRRKKWNVYTFATRLFVISAIAFLATSIFLRAYNSYLNVRIHDYNASIASMKKENEMVRMEVNQLSTYDRISSITLAQGTWVAGNIFNIPNE